MNAHLMIDGYKLGHIDQYPAGTTQIFSNFTARKSRRNLKSTVFFGLQSTLITMLELWQTHFFDKPLELVINDYKNTITSYLGTESRTDHIKQLHELGHLPITIMALPEGSHVNIGVPSMIMFNTHPDFAWLVNYLETFISTQLWPMCTSATTAYQYRELLDHYAFVTCDNDDHVDFQAHDFSFRGMFSLTAAAMSGAAHLTSFKGSDTIPAIELINTVYGPYSAVHSVPATEHSVMCAGGKDNELATFKRLITEIYPVGIVSIVSDTWDFWNVLTNFTTQLKDEIMARDGKVVFRPDSGDPIEIICGQGYGHENTINKWQIYGAVEALWDIFGGTINSKGYKVLDPHVGIIYGDSITLERAEEICRRLEVKGFASSNIVFGIGSYTYQYVTRDTDGYAMKATWAKINDEEVSLFKDPITDDGTKKSAKGLLSVTKVGDDFILKQESTWHEVLNCAFLPAMVNGILTSVYSFNEIRDRIAGDTSSIKCDCCSIFNKITSQELKIVNQLEKPNVVTKTCWNCSKEIVFQCIRR